MPNSEKKEMKTMAALLNNLAADGFNEQFKVEEDRLKAMSSEVSYGPEEAKILNFYRFEGDSDPSDNAIISAIETADGIRGTLTDAYGTYSDEGIHEFITSVEEIKKKTTPGEKL